MPVRTALLSSTGRDLAIHRDAVYQAIEGMDGYHCVRMEDFGARDWPSDEFCRAKVAECDLYIGIVGHLYGSSPEESEQSYTEREYDAAIAANRPRLMFVAPSDFPLPADLREPDDRQQQQRAFRERVDRERVRDTFASPDDLARRVVQAIRNWEQQGQRTSQRQPLADEVSELIAAIQSRSKRLSEYMAQAHSLARRAGDGSLEQFCKDELTGWERGDDVSDIPDYRVADAFASATAQINPQSIAFIGGIDSVIQYMRNRPDHFTPIENVFTQSLSAIEDLAIEASTGDLATVERTHSDLDPDSPAPDARVIVYIHPSSFQRVLNMIGHELTKKLLDLLSRLDAAQSGEVS